MIFSLNVSQTFAIPRDKTGIGTTTVDVHVSSPSFSLSLSHAVSLSLPLIRLHSSRLHLFVWFNCYRQHHSAPVALHPN